MSTRSDFTGLPVTASAADVAAWDAAAQDFLGYHGGAALTELTRSAPQLAVGRALHAVLAATGGAPGVDPAAELAAAQGALDGASERERAFVASVVAEVGREPGPPSPWLAYLRDYPADLLGRYAAMVDVLFAFRPDRATAVDALVADGLAVNGRHPFLASAQAMLAQEEADLDRAQELAAAVLAEHPDYVAAAHVVTHVHFERGDHTEGLDWLEGWVRGVMRPGCEYAPHLSWHAGLHELALDDRAAVLRRLAVLAGPEADQDWLLSNGASYLWRLKLAGVVDPGDDPSGGVIAERAGAVVADPPFLFLGWHAAMGLACSGDVAGLRAVAAGDHADGAPGVAEVLPAVATAFADLLEDSPSRAADGLLAVLGHGPRLGGSHAQREVLEDTLLAALVRAGRTEEAARALMRRLDRRPSATDGLRLAALRVPSARQGTATAEGVSPLPG